MQVHTLGMAILMTAAACGGDPTDAAGPVPAAIVDVIDADNFGDGRDIRVTIERPADESGISEYRILIVKAPASGFDVTAASALPASRRGVLAVGGAEAYSPGAAAVDTDGDSVVQGVAYRIFLQTVPVAGEAPPLSTSPATITLRRTHLVRTLTDVIQAGSGGMEVDAQGRIYHADFGATLSGPPGTRIHRISPAGVVSVWVEGLSGASGNTFGPNGDLFQSNINAGRISRITPDGSVSTFATGMSAPVGIAIDSFENLYVANCGDNTIRKVLPDGSTEPFADSPLLDCPNGITLAADGNFYVANFSNGDVLRVTPDGEVSRFVTIEGGNNGHILFGNGVLYVVARAANRLYQVTLDGQASVLAGSGARRLRDGAARDAGLSLTNDIALSPDGTILYFNDVATTGTEFSVISPVVVRALIFVVGAE
jgi:sugar lactone lactonase YvrE